MVSIKSSILASTVVAISAVNAADVTAEQTADLLVIINDIESHVSDYLSLETSGSSDFQVPPEVLSLYAQINTYTDESYTSLFTELDVAALTATITNLPWYSTRLLPALQRANAGASSNETESSSVAVSESASASASVSESVSASITASSNITIEETSSVSQARNSSSITHVSSSASHSSTKESSKNSTSTSHSGNSTSSKTSSSAKNGAEYVGASSGLLFAGLAALLL
ncbi:similar to Saccharomyces cerevisiae YBR067C TIP1 Major cell wall mannoprotein with possible lipase activity [Maudiozyma saulgeensis]|uniref:Similar to Saccharomyces cerevisiae YBR067C TIP1 Major cell wall mannoprotein with possible lipase activity n=1 Tax=Maudiozyma saulgeensis TaxID=1789683 RepID=A0A1X7R6M2_9SACH|nr:similar to Saccharomyces cerevisiae YBR067C TIP1 Major cell wall mannoprotein with possible lipase activity [Kazachstania saulgeensis]